MRTIIDAAYKKCTDILDANRDRIEQIAEFLLAHNTMSRPQFEAAMAGRPIPENKTASVFDAHREEREPETKAPENTPEDSE